MKKNKLEYEEAELLDSIEAGEWDSVENLESEMIKHKNIAADTLKKDKRVNLRLSAKDLDAIKAYAVEEGLPYQTLISSVLHKFISGRLIERQIR